MNSFSVEQKRVDVFESAAPNKPVIYLNTYGREGAQIFQYLTDIGCQDFSLVAVSKLEWNHDMVPWNIPPIFKNGASYTSGADEYLRLLINQIIPESRKSVAGDPPPGGELRDIHWPDCLHCILFIRRTPFRELRVSPARCGFRELKSMSFPVHS